MPVRVQSDPFDYGSECEAFAAEMAGPGTNPGAIVTFAGIVRDDPDAPLQRMEIEHYPGMTERALEEFRANAAERWSLSGALVIHQFGAMRPGEMIMMVATAARHRADAFEAAEFLMDYLKSRAPFWKKEIRASGTGWVAERAADTAALDRWS